MSIVCAVKKGGMIAISSDTQSNFGSITISAKHITNSNKLFTVNKSIVGIVGWNAITDVMQHLIETEKSLFQLGSRMETFSTLIKLHEKMKDDYFIETNEDSDQPVESNQLDAIIVNKSGIYKTGSYREVNEFKTFCAMGSGKRFAIGAMHALYGSKATAKQIAQAGVMAATEFDDGCGLPMNTKTLRIGK